jgi:hypothetical protein
MPRRPSNRPAASQPSSFLQNFIDEPIDSIIETRVVHEKGLESADLEWLFGPLANSPRSVGISPAYSKSGSLPSLACAIESRVLVINFYGTKARDDGRTSGARPRDIIGRRSRLEQELLCHPECTLYSFDLATFALSLHLHFQIHLANAVDIQSALHVHSRSPVNSVRAIVGDQILMPTLSAVPSRPPFINMMNKRTWVLWFRWPGFVVILVKSEIPKTCSVIPPKLIRGISRRM